MMNIITIEDLLEVTAGLHADIPKIDIETSDKNIMYSVARQVFKGTALTDRQFALMQEKLKLYESQFSSICNFHEAVNKLRMPLRNIDRSKYITIVSADQVFTHPKDKSNYEYLKIRFPFSKKSILKLQGITKERDEYIHHKGSHEHFFQLTERSIWRLVNSFEDCGFDIDDNVLELYNQIQQIKNEEYIIKVENNQLLNMHPRGKEQLETLFGEIDSFNIICYKDRSMLYGITKFDDKANLDIERFDILSKHIANRTVNEIHVDSNQWTLDNLFNSFFVLQRFPLVIFLDENDPYSILSTTYQHIRNLIDPSEISVLYRLPSDVSNGYNEYIKDNKLNNPLDKNTKVVYTCKNKVNKPLLQSECKPVTALMTNNLRTAQGVMSWVMQFDLVVDYAPEPNLIPRFSRNKWKFYGNM